MSINDRNIKLIEDFFNRVSKPITCKVLSQGGKYFINIEDRYVMVYDPNTFNPIWVPTYRFMVGDKLHNIGTFDNDMYKLLDNFLPHLSDKIEIYAIRKDLDNEDGVIPPLTLLPNYYKENEPHRSF